MRFYLPCEPRDFLTDERCLLRQDGRVPPERQAGHGVRARQERHGEDGNDAQGDGTEQGTNLLLIH